MALAGEPQSLLPGLDSATILLDRTEGDDYQRDESSSIILQVRWEAIRLSGLLPGTHKKAAEQREESARRQKYAN